MKSQRKLLIVMLILLAKFTFAQKETKFYWNEKWESVSKKENPSYYSLISLGDNDVPLSDIKTYYITGELYTKYTIIKFDRNNGKNILCQGLKKDYYKNGNLKFEGKYTNEGKANGLLKFYYENGKTKQIGNYLNGLPHGEVIAYYENDKIRFTTYYKNGKANGTQIMYYENGNKESIVPLVDDVQNGLVQEFYENGKLKTEANYLNGKYHGKYIEYDENGNKKSEKNYNNGNIEYRTDGVYVVDIKNAFDLNDKNYYVGINNNSKHLIAIKFENNGEYVIYSSYKKSNHGLFNNNIYWSNEDDLIYCIKKYILNSDKVTDWWELQVMSNTHKLVNLFEVTGEKDIRRKGFEKYSKLYYEETITVAPWCTYLVSLYRLLDGKVYYKGLTSAYTSGHAENDKQYEEITNSENELKFLEIPELSNESIKKQKEKELALLQAKQEEEKKEYQLKKEAEAKQAILFEENRKAKLKNLQIGDRVSWSQGWKNTDKFFGFTFSETNYNMNVICYIENVSGDRYQIRVANIKSTSSSNWEYPELNGVPLKEGTLHWIKPSDYINDKSWHYME